MLPGSVRGELCYFYFVCCGGICLKWFTILRGDKRCPGGIFYCKVYYNNVGGCRSIVVLVVNVVV
jgi:hypothetical protein